MNIGTIKAKIILLFIGFFAIVTLGATTERTVYSQTSNKELKQKSIQLVKNVRSLVDSYKKQDRDSMAQYDKKDRSDMSKGAAHNQDSNGSKTPTWLTIRQCVTTKIITGPTPYC